MITLRGKTARNKRRQTRKVTKVRAPKVTVTKTVKPLAPTTRAQVAKIAEAVVKRDTETQYICDNHELNFDAIYGDTYPTGGSVQVFSCLPQIVQSGGEQSYGRRGVKVEPVKHCTDLQFCFSPEQLISTGGPAARVDSVAWDVTVHIWYGYVKRYKSTDDVNANKIFIANNLFEIDGSTQQRFSGRLRDLTYERNAEFGALKHKSFRMFKDQGLANTLTSQYFPAVTQKKLRLWFKPPKSLKYADDTSFYPENYAPFVLIGYCHNDNTQASNTNNSGPTSTITQIPAIQVLRVNKVWFKDA